MAKDFNPNADLEDVPMWAKEEACRLVNDISYTSRWNPFDVDPDSNPALSVLAMKIWQHEEPPVDPYVLAMREILAAGQHDWVTERSPKGSSDDNVWFQAAVAKLRELVASGVLK